MCLYVLDNETNFVVKVSVFIGLAIEVWKIGKVVNVKVSSNYLKRQERVVTYCCSLIEQTKYLEFFQE